VRSSLDQRVKDLENAGTGVDQFTELTDVPNSYSGQGGKYVRVNAGATALEFVTLAGGGDLLSTNNLSDVANVATARTNLGLDTTANQTDSTDKRFMSDAQEAKLDAITGTNTGDQTSIVGISGTKAQFDTACSDGNFVYTGDAIPAANITQDASNRFVTDAEKSTWNGKQNALTNPVTGTGTNNEIAAFNSTGSTITSLSTATYPSLTELSYVKGVTSKIQDQLNAKEPTITNGFGITGTTTKAVSLTSTQAFCTQETTISATAYADITGASITLAAGTWLIMGTINGSSQTTTAAVIIGAITDGANTVIAEGAQHIVAGTATVRTWGNLSLSAVVTPSGSTTYKLRGARGVTTQTGNWIASDGTGQGTANNVSNNSDKSTAIMAVRIA